MISRRDILMGSACVLAAGGAYALKPRRLVSLLAPGQHLDAIVPRKFRDWSSRDIGDLFAPEDQDSLQAKLYEETVGRLYQQASSGAEIVMLMAYGGVQSNELQLHRPEVCYPAFGYEILSNYPIQLSLAKNVTVPARQLVAKSPDRQETVVYWTRLGEFLPSSLSEQRMDRLETAFHGYVSDGLLARFSIVGSDPIDALKVLEDFIPDLIRATPARQRRALIGTERSRAMTTVV